MIMLISYEKEFHSTKNNVCSINRVSEFTLEREKKTQQYQNGDIRHLLCYHVPIHS